MNYKTQEKERKKLVCKIDEKKKSKMIIIKLKLLFCV